MQAATAGLMPAVGWFAAVFIMAMPTRGGSVVITSTSGGKWFLYGGTVCALAGVVASFATQARARAQGRDGWAGRPGAPRHAAPRPGREPGQ
jgi:amino acid transporter